MLILASPSALLGRKWFPGCLSAASVHSGPADRLWCSANGELFAHKDACCLSAGSACAPREIWPTHSWILTLSVAAGAWYSLWFFRLRHFGISYFSDAGRRAKVVNWGEFCGRVNTHMGLLLPGMSSGMIKSIACVLTLTCLSRHRYKSQTRICLKAPWGREIQSGCTPHSHHNQKQTSHPITCDIQLH